MGIISAKLKISIGSTPVHKKNLLHRKEGISSRSAKAVPDSKRYCCSIEFIHFSRTLPAITFLSLKLCLQLSLEEQESRMIGVTISSYFKIFYGVPFGGTIFQSLRVFSSSVSTLNFIFLHHTLCLHLPFSVLHIREHWQCGYEGGSYIMFWGWFGFGFVVED